jgi:hypothetical protein
MLIVNGLGLSRWNVIRNRGLIDFWEEGGKDNQLIIK